jgi:hypothetical protein
MDDVTVSYPAVVTAVWEGRRPRDAVFERALRALGITQAWFDRLAREARRAERGWPRFLIRTPSNGKPR